VDLLSEDHVGDINKAPAVNAGAFVL